MSYHTVSLFEYLISELNNAGVSEFEDFKKDQLIINDFDSSYINKIMTYNEEVEEIVTHKIFMGYCLTKNEHDRDFKKMFLTTFLNRQIDFQTMSLFSSKLVGKCYSYDKFLNSFYENYDNFITNRSDSLSIDDVEGIRNHRQAYSSLPQELLNLKINDMNVKVADDNTIAFTGDKNNAQKNSNNETYSLDNLIKSMTLLQDVMREFGKLFIRWNG